MTDTPSGEMAHTKFGRETTINLIGQLFGRATSFAFVLIITRMVNPGTYGTFTLALSIVAVTTGLFELGLSRAIDYYIPVYVRENDRGSPRALLSFVVKFLGISLFLGTVFLLFVRDEIAIFMNAPDLPPFLTVLSLAVILNGFLKVLSTLFSAVGKMKYRVLISGAGHPLAKFALIIPPVYAGYVTFGLTVGYLASLVFVLATGVYILYTGLDSVGSDVISSTGTTIPSHKSIFSYTAPLYLQELIYKVQNHASYFVLGFYLGTTSIGVYQVGYQLTSLMALASGAMAPAFKPAVARADSTQKIKSVYRTAARWLALVTIPLVVVVTAASESLIDILFSPEYGHAVVVIVPLAAGILANSITGPQDMLLEGKGYSNLILTNSVINITVRLGLLLILVPVFGVLGAGIAVGVSMAFIPFLAVAEIYVLERYHPFSRDLLKQLLAGIGSYIMCRSIMMFFSRDLVVLVVVSVTTIVTFIAFMNFLDGFSDEDARIAREIDEMLGYRVISKVVR